MKLENWSVVVLDDDPYKAPELKTSHLHGKVFGHPRFDDGTIVSTSSIKSINEGLIVTKSGSNYDLGEVDPEYEKLYPDAKNRLIKSLQKE